MRVRVGYTAEYAAFVHEMPDPKITSPAGGTSLFVKVKPIDWTKPGTGNKFLEKAVKSNLKAILNMIWFSARIK